MTSLTSRVLISDVAIVLLGGICACTNPEQPPIETPAPSEESTHAQDDQTTQDDDSATSEGNEASTAPAAPTYTLGELHDLGDDYFIKRGDSFQSAQQCTYEASQTGRTAWTLEGMYFSPREGDERVATPQLSRAAGDSLITTSTKETLVFYRVENSGYFSTGSTGPSDGEIHPEEWETINGQDIPENWDDMDESAQNEFLTKNFEPLGIDLLTGGGIGDTCRLPTSSAPTTYSYGQFDGTEYVETTVELNVPYLYADLSTEQAQAENIISCPVLETREGYFTVDISNLKKGTYFIDGIYSTEYARIDIVD